MPTFNKDGRFDLYLASGEAAEQRVAELLTNKKIEVKTELSWYRTGNIAIEFECRGKLSGIASTQADYWFHELRDKQNAPLHILVFPVQVLRDICRSKVKAGKFVTGGEDMVSKMVLLPIERGLLSYLRDFYVRATSELRKHTGYPIEKQQNTPYSPLIADQCADMHQAHTKQYYQ